MASVRYNSHSAAGSDAQCLLELVTNTYVVFLNIPMSGKLRSF